MLLWESYKIFLYLSFLICRMDICWCVWRKARMSVRLEPNEWREHSSWWYQKGSRVHLSGFNQRSSTSRRWKNICWTLSVAGSVLLYTKEVNQQISSTNTGYGLQNIFCFPSTLQISLGVYSTWKYTRQRILGNIVQPSEANLWSHHMEWICEGS